MQEESNVCGECHPQIESELKENIQSCAFLMPYQDLLALPAIQTSSSAALTSLPQPFPAS